jgi:hypothetical protein
MILPRGPLIIADSAASSRLGQAHSTSPVASVRRRISARMCVLDCLLFRLHLASLIIRIPTFTFIYSLSSNELVQLGSNFGQASDQLWVRRVDVTDFPDVKCG